MEYNSENVENKIIESNDIDINLSDHILKINSFEKLITKKKRLIEIAKNLTKIEYLEIFNIIQEDNCVYSENKNGIFINLSNVSENTIDKIYNFIYFIQHKKEDLIKHDEYVNNAKKNITENKVIPSNNITLNENTENMNYENESDDNNHESNNNYLVFSSDEDENEDLEKILLKKKKIKYTGKKAKMIKSIKDSGDKNKNKLKKTED